MIYSTTSIAFERYIIVYLYRFLTQDWERVWCDKVRSRARLTEQEIRAKALIYSKAHEQFNCRAQDCRLPVVTAAITPCSSFSSLLDIPLVRLDKVSQRNRPCAMFLSSGCCGSDTCRNIIIGQNLLKASSIEGVLTMNPSEQAELDQNIDNDASAPVQLFDRLMLGETVLKHRCMGCLEIRADCLRCTGCHSSYYCSETCQKKDWIARHSLICQDLAKNVWT